MTDSRKVFGPKRLLKQPKEYLHIPIEDRGKTVADVFVASQDLPGLQIEYIDTDEDDDTLDFGDEDFDLSEGRAFLVKAGYEIVQLPARNYDEALKLLP